MRSEKLAVWPEADAISGFFERDLTRAGRLIQALKKSDVNTSVLMAPTTFVSADNVARSEAYKKQCRQCTEAQAEVLENWTPATAVPRFQLKIAAGNAGLWNYLTATFEKGKQQAWWPVKQHGTPNPEFVNEFLGCRIDSKGNSLLSYFKAPIPMRLAWDIEGSSVGEGIAIGFRQGIDSEAKPSPELGC